MKHNILFVDDEINILKSLQRALMDEDYNCLIANSSQEALKIIESTNVSVVVTDMRMPEMDGFDLLKTISPKYPDIVKVIFTGYADITKIAATISQISIFKFILKPWDLEAELKPALRQCIEQYELVQTHKMLTLKLEEKDKELVLINEELSVRFQELETKHATLEKLTECLEDADSIIVAIASAVEAKDLSTKGHIVRVSDLAQKIGEKFGFTKEEMSVLNKGAILHDLGKIGTPDVILNKQGPLTPEEFEIMKEHTMIGSKIISSLKTFKEISAIIRHHHEKLNGSGYPDGLKGDEIDLFTRIVAVVDIYDALTMNRSYRAAMPQEKALQILDGDVAKGLLDENVVKLLKEVIGVA